MIEMLKGQDIPTLLAGVVVALSLNLLFKIGEFSWNLIKHDKKRLTTALEANTIAVTKLEKRLETAEEKLADFPKVKTDLRRLFAATKVLAGDEWPQIRQAILDEELPNQ